MWGVYTYFDEKTGNISLNNKTNYIYCATILFLPLLTFTIQYTSANSILLRAK